MLHGMTRGGGILFAALFRASPFNPRFVPDTAQRCAALHIVVRAMRPPALPLRSLPSSRGLGSHSRDCPVFYMRKKVQKDLKEQQEQLDRFGSIEW